MSQCDLMYTHLDRQQARKLLSKFLTAYKQGKAYISVADHFYTRCAERSVSFNDAINILIAGKINKQGEPHIKIRGYVYNVETDRMEVSFQFLDENRIRLITVKRKGAP